MPGRFLQTVETHRNAVALRKKEYGLWHDITWGEYYRQSEIVGAALIQMGLQSEDKVGIVGDNCTEWLMIEMGTLGAGGVTVGIYSTNAAPQLEYVVDHSDSRFLFLENEEQLDKWLEFKTKPKHLEKVIVWDLEGLRDFKHDQVMTYEELLEVGRGALQENPDLYKSSCQKVSPENLSFFIYTSGTTGPPKGAMLTHKNVMWETYQLSISIPMKPGDEVLSFLPLCHVFEQIFSVFLHINGAYTVNFIESPGTVAENMIEVSPTLGYAVPRIWEKYQSTILIRMQEADWFKRSIFAIAYKISNRKAEFTLEGKEVPFFVNLGALIAYWTVFRKLKEKMGFDRFRFALTGAASIAKEVLYFYHSIGVEMCEGYGQTECVGVCNFNPPGKVRAGTVGTAIRGIEHRIAEDGEILVRGKSVFKGYYKNPEATDQTLEGGWLHTGDVGMITDEGYLNITDRKKDIIVTAGGKNISPQYIENKLKVSPYINDSIVIGDARKFITCLVMIDEDNVIQYAQKQKIQFSTYLDLTENPSINKLIGEEVSRVNNELAQVEKIKKFTILPKKLFEEDGEVTPTMKIKRKSINELFKDLIDNMYAS
ncbi:MAG: long-chain fatty acid--CoA ligase [Proteobacteria bacterium]|nr:long-chain fatty acid--CoA ligase [Pseudomonadota bacterium]